MSIVQSSDQDIMIYEDANSSKFGLWSCIFIYKCLSLRLEIDGPQAAHLLFVLQDENGRGRALPR